MEIIGLIFLGLVIWAISGVFKSGDFDHLKVDDNGEKYKDTVFVDYYGGFRDVSVKNNKSLNIYFFEEKVRFVFSLDRKMNSFKDIPRENIKSVRFINETSLTESISVGKVLVFGWIGLMMRDKKEINKEYILLTCEYEDEEINLVLNSGFNIEEKFRIINEYIMTTNKI